MAGLALILYISSIGEGMENLDLEGNYFENLPPDSGIFCPMGFAILVVNIADRRNNHSCGPDNIRQEADKENLKNYQCPKDLGEVWRRWRGGGMFLFDQDGKLIAKDPSAEELRKELDSRLAMKIPQS